MTTNPLLTKISEASKILGVSTTTIQKLVKSKKLIGVGFGTGSRTNFVTRESLDTLIGGLRHAN